MINDSVLGIKSVPVESINLSSESTINQSSRFHKEFNNMTTKMTDAELAQ